ncbi:MAG: GNAT family N-acetyltransferase, partial [Armatimonadota bacterium]
IAGSGMFKGDLVDGWIEIGYGVSPEVEGRGVGTAIARHLTEYALESGASVVRAHTLSDAPASQRILEKLGYQYVGQFEEPEDGLVNRYEVIKSGEVDE